jgi:hypothetical protein
VAAEGCFYILITKSNTHKIGHKILLKFIIGQHSRDTQLIESLISYLGCGIYTQKDNYVEFVAQKFTDIFENIIPFFEKYPLQGVKVKDFLDFCKAAKIIERKDHLTKDGLEQILTLKQSMNRGRK